MDPAPTSSPASNDARLLQLERQLRRTRALLAVVGLIGVAGVIAHFLPGPDTLAARRMILLDAHRNIRGELAASDAGEVFIRLNNTAGKARLMWWLGRDGANGLRMSDDSGVSRLELGWERDGTPALILAGPDGHTRTRVTVFDPPNTAAISVYDAENHRRWIAPEIAAEAR